MALIENFELSEEFGPTVSQFTIEISDLKANLCEKQAKIQSRV